MDMLFAFGGPDANLKTELPVLSPSLSPNASTSIFINRLLLVKGHSISHLLSFRGC